MIKLTTTQAKAVACKIRERVQKLRNEKREQLRKEYRETDEYKVKQHEVHEACITVWQASLKLNLKLGIRISCYCGYDMYSEKDVEDAEKHIMAKVEDEYVSKVYDFPSLPTEETLTQDLIFESLMSDGIEVLMDKFIEQYL
jgi:hypothetical protein